MKCLVLFQFLLLIGSALLEPFEKPCEANDSMCLEENLLETAAIILSGLPELAIDSSDPLYLEYIDGELPVLNFEFYNSTLNGLKDCRFQNISINEDASNLRVVYDCPRIKLVGKYKIAASVFFITSRGNYVMKTERYLVTVNAAIERTTSSTGANHLQLDKFTLKCELMGVLELELKSTDTTSSLLVNMANQYIKDNYRTVASYTQDSVWTAIVRKHFDNLNKYLMTRPMEEILVIN